MSTPENASPISRRTGSVGLKSTAGIYCHVFKFDDADTDDLIFTESLHLSWWDNTRVPYSSKGGGRPMATGEQTEAVAALIESYLWRSKRGLGKQLIVCLAEDMDRIIDNIADKEALPYYSLRSFEDLLQESNLLTFEQKALMTLENLYRRFELERKPIVLTTLIGTDNSAQFTDVMVECTTGIAFGVPESNAHFVFEYLYQQEYVRHAGQQFYVTSKGYAQVEQLRREQLLSIPEVFVIRRWDKELDKFLNPVFDEVSKRISVPIKAVWSDEHNDKIDERIFIKIRKAAAIVLHITANRFNVGLETGYALALGKPIVVIREKPAEDADDYIKHLPFDIATLNCYDYEESGRDELIDKLEARLLVALS